MDPPGPGRMPEPITTYRIHRHGLWNVRHEVHDQTGKLGVLVAERRPTGLTQEAVWRPEKGEVLTMRRGPGLLRSQFSIWTENREWLGSSLRSNFLRREILLSTPSKSLRLVPVPGFRRGWRLHAPKTGEMACVVPRGIARTSEVLVYRRLELEIVLLAYLLGSLVYAESFWPGRAADDDLESLPTASSSA